MYFRCSTLGENVGRSNSLEIIQIIDLPGEILPGAGRPRYFREISIVDFFPRFVHAKDDGTIASRSKSRREKLVDDRSRVQSNQQLFKYAIQRQIRDHILKPSRAFVEAVAQPMVGSIQIRVLDSIIIRRAIFDSTRVSSFKRGRNVSRRECLSGATANALQST